VSKPFVDEVVAIAMSDIHLTLQPPLARSREPDWKEAMARPLRKVAWLAKKHGAVILCAGDLFDRPLPQPELLNWALDHLPRMYGIPGNHDLPYHRPDLEHRSGFGTLVRAGRIVDLSTSGPLMVGPFCLYGARLGGVVPKRTPHHADHLGLKHVLLIHRYLWVPGCGYEGAQDEDRLANAPRRFSDFDVVVVGDNHQCFKRRLRSGTRVVNCGALMRRKSDEIDYRPRVALLWRSGKVTLTELGRKKDIIERVEPSKEQSQELQSFVESLAGLEVSGLSFRDAIQQAVRESKLSKKARRSLLEAMGE
jgi:DNA repair exonuclease SbcCD nuclease subunit